MSISRKSLLCCNRMDSCSMALHLYISSSMYAPVWTGGDKVGMAEAKLMKVESESSVGLHSDSLVEPSSEAACTRRQLLLALSLLKHLAHNSPTACEALIHAGLIESARRYDHAHILRTQYIFNPILHERSVISVMPIRLFMRRSYHAARLKSILFDPLRIPKKVNFNMGRQKMELTRLELATF